MLRELWPVTSVLDQSLKLEKWSGEVLNPQLAETVLVSDMNKEVRLFISTYTKNPLSQVQSASTTNLK